MNRQAHELELGHGRNAFVLQSDWLIEPSALESLLQPPTGSGRRRISAFGNAAHTAGAAATRLEGTP